MSNSPGNSTTSDDNLDEGTKLHETKHHKLSTVHPNVVLRTPIFTPIARSASSKVKGRMDDLSDTTQELSIVQAEGYHKVTISGAQLDIETDFRVWCGITKMFEVHGFCEQGAVASFKEFAGMCRYTPKELRTSLRERIDRSLTRIMSQVVSFYREDGKTMKTHLIQWAEYDANTDTIKLVPDVRLWELYRIDHNIILYIEHQEALKNREVAQCLYVFIEALPNKPAPLSFARLRDRVRLRTAQKAEANRAITKALGELKKIGYLEYDIVTKNGERYVLIHGRKKPAKSITNCF